MRERLVIVRGRNKRSGKTDINPNSLFGLTLSSILGCLELGLELSDNQSEHILATAQKDTTSGVVSPGLSLVKALEGILLGSLRSTLMRLEKGRVKEEEKGLEKSGRGLVLTIDSRLAEREKASSAEESNSYAGIVHRLQLKVSAKRQNVTTL